jgi:hypothetical protein
MMTETIDSSQFTEVDDGLHELSGFYDNETFWFSFFVPERSIGGWLYTTIRPVAGVSGGGAWIWDASAVNPWSIPFFEQFSALKLPTGTTPGRLAFPNGVTVVRREPLLSYDLEYDDRKRLRVALQFDAVEPPVPLLTGAPPYPAAHHFDQIGHVTGTIELDGETIPVDCFAMRDRSWGRRNERGYRRVGYTWAGDTDLSLLTYTSPTADSDDVHTGYLRRDGQIGRLVGGRRVVTRDPESGWVTAIEIDAEDELGRTVHAEAEASSRMILPGSTTICINSVLRYTIDDRVVHGEDQDVWPIDEWRSR